MGFPAVQVTPKRWSNIRVLFDNGWYSVIDGTYVFDDGTSGCCLGERWNGAPGGKGFPLVRGFPVWHVVPEFLETAILQAVLTELQKNPHKQQGQNKKERVEWVMQWLED